VGGVIQPLRSGARAGAVLLVALAAMALPAPAHALVTSTATIDGPSADIADLGGTAMASDGTGAIVYRKYVNGRPHIFAAQFTGGAWRQPQRVDTGQVFESSWPVVAAGDNGRLVVAWVQEFGDADRLYAASMAPGSTRFQPPVPVDLNVGDASLGTSPSIAMARGGQAYLVYRVVTAVQPAGAPPGSVAGEIRMARFGGQYWTSAGLPLDRNVDAALPTPVIGNGPRVATDVQGDAVVAWTEFDDQFVPRVYARRVLSGGTGIALQVSPSTMSDGKVAVPTGVDRFDLDVGDFGQTAIAYRQLATGKPPFTRPRILVAESPDVYSDSANVFAEPRFADGAGSDAPKDPVGAPTVAAQTSAFATTFSMGNAATSVLGDDDAVDPSVRLDEDEDSTTGGDPQVDLAPSGAAAYAWRSGIGGKGGVTVREHRSDGVDEDRTAAAPLGGQVDAFDLEGSGLGDAIVGFTQGTDSGRQVAAAVVDAPPDEFAVQTPIDWVNAKRVTLQWDPPEYAIGGVSYTVVVDDDTIVEGLKGTTNVLKLGDLDDGVRIVQVVATDAGGQETSSIPAELKLDRTAPKVRVSRRGRKVTISVSDGKADRVSGIASTRVNFGDRHATAKGKHGASRRLRARHRYHVVVSTKDDVGNRRVVRKVVRIP
jgi:hypothetical protein